ncbi:O-antigen ligase family protein [Novosphingobium jiangmenense]|uniref:O-antigen ligase family protein n=1 Tax=Novosphingobium jiangmenense TaxID=2791981 RepID=A0ABS0HJ25_9SPHN|nr:O-antigen ligase family protein [Novosphingobium jiangmenense]
MSLAPLATFNALLALSIPVATISACQTVSFRRIPDVVFTIVVLGCVSCILAALQASGLIIHSQFDTVSELSAIGLFANRNHQALLQACLLPFLGWLGARFLQGPSRSILRFVTVASAALSILALSAITGSRFGLFLCCGGAILAVLIAIRESRQRVSALARACFCAGTVVFLLFSWTAVRHLPRAESIVRLISLDADQDLRWAVLPTTTTLIGKYWPIGAGVGSYASVYRVSEPLATLGPSYVNHAHNDLLESLVEGGMISGALLTSTLGWILFRAFGTSRRGIDAANAGPIRLAAVFLLLVCVASLVDYPMRTPIFQALSVIAVWILGAPSGSRDLEYNQPLDNGAAGSVRK